MISRTKKISFQAIQSEHRLYPATIRFILICSRKCIFKCKLTAHTKFTIARSIQGSLPFYTSPFTPIPISSRRVSQKYEPPGALSPNLRPEPTATNLPQLASLATCWNDSGHGDKLRPDGPAESPVDTGAVSL